MAKLDLKTRDYIVESLDENFDVDLIQAIIMRLNIHRGKYWADPNLGSRFYLLRRSKDVTRMLQIVKQYAEEALADLIPNRLQALVVSTTQSIKSRIDLHIEITRLTGEKQTIPYFVSVGG